MPAFTPEQNRSVDSKRQQKGRGHSLWLLLAAVLMCGFAGTQLGAQSPDDEFLPAVGDAPADAGSLATDLSPQLKKPDVARAIEKVADWQLDRVQNAFDRDWTFAALYTGFMAVPDAAQGKKYRDAMLQMGKKFNWQPGIDPTDANDLAVAQTYLDLYMQYRDPAMLMPIEKRVESQMQLEDKADKPLWWWCDALFMAPPTIAKLSRATGNRKYLDFMDREWWITSDLLYSQKDHLYFRDKSYLQAHEANGRSVFWSRGDGWVFAGLARVLAEMPKDYPARPRYVARFREMAQAIASIQGSDGLWRPGLLDADNYPLPENSGSAFFAYGLAYGINASILDRKTYRPVVEKAWRGLLA
ncbi:MAG TPA: glycoside hydrolase family 88 protein, partial [Acidobacteriaceae bacterium]